MVMATFRHGKPRMVDYTPVSAVNAGDVVLAGNTTGLTNIVAHEDIAAGALGAAAAGGGIYAMQVAGNYTAYTKVYWDGANTVLTTTSTNMSLFGYTVQAAAAANAVIDVLHNPYA